MSRCPWKIHWGVGQDSTTQCLKPVHIIAMTVEQMPDMRIAVSVDGDPEHEGPGLPSFPEQRITWQAGDRREYTGDWPGLCPHQPCTLHREHHGRHAP